MLRILMAEAELELVPAEVAGHPAIREPARVAGKRPGEILLDQNQHNAALGRLAEGRRRGRPDIVHTTLLVLLESPLAKAGALEVAIHTRHGLLVRVRGDTRLPRGEARFQGLMAKVLRDGASQPGPDPLVAVEATCSPAEALRRFAGDGPVVRLDEGGQAVTPAAIADMAAPSGAHTVVLGAFPSGAFSPEWVAAAPTALSIWPEALNAWAVAAEVVAAHRARWGPAAPARTPPAPASAVAAPLTQKAQTEPAPLG